MGGVFEVDRIASAEQVLLSKYADLVQSTFLGDLSAHDYRITILKGRRNKLACGVMPPLVQGSLQPSEPPRICHILENGVHVHQYPDRSLCIIDVPLSVQT